MKPTRASNRDFYIPLPAEIFSDFCQRLTPTVWSVLSTIYRQVNFETGFWHGSAAKVAAAWGGQLAKRTIQRALDRLNELGYIKSFHVPGRRGNYEVAIDGYAIRFGPLDGQSLDAANTTDPNHPVYAKRGNFVSLRNRSTCHRGDEVEPQRQVADTGSRNPNDEKGSEGIPQRQVRQKKADKTTKNSQRVAEKEGGSGTYVARIPEVQQQQQQHDGDGLGKENPNTAAQEKAFLVEVYQVLDSHGASHEATLDHQKKALALAAEHGPQVFLRALECWLGEAGQTWQKKDRRYPLAHFVTSGQFEYYVRRVKDLAEQSDRAEVAAERQQKEADVARRRQIIKEELIREEDAVGREFADWQAKHGTPDGFIPSDAVAFERYVLRERLVQWTPESGDSWAALDAQRRAVIGAAIEARLSETRG
jgi:hypothetical protein